MVNAAEKTQTPCAAMRLKPISAKPERRRLASSMDQEANSLLGQKDAEAREINMKY